LLEADFSYTALYREMAERIGLFPRRGTEVIQAVTLTEDESAQLRTPPRAAAFHIERTGWVEETAIEFRTTLVRGGRFRGRPQCPPPPAFPCGSGATGPSAPPPVAAGAGAPSRRPPRTPPTRPVRSAALAHPRSLAQPRPLAHPRPLARPPPPAY